MPTQEHRLLAISITGLDEDKLLVEKFSMTDQMARLFEIQVELSSEDRKLNFDDVVGVAATIRLTLPSGKMRYFNGFISRFVQMNDQGGFGFYHATIVPWIWFLTRTADCRIFQKKKIPDIIEEVFKGHSFKDYQLKLTPGRYDEWEYCVQYRETDFNFVSRLMEHEGIYYYFKHTEDGHSMVTADSFSAHEEFEGYGELKYRPQAKAIAEEEEIITEWTIEKEVQPGQYVLTDFNFTKPKVSLLANSNITRQHPEADYEIFDYPGEYELPKDGDAYAKIRIQELQSRYEILRGETAARGIATGCKFTLKEHPRDDQNREYLITGVTINASSGEYVSGGKSEKKEFFSCSFTAIPLDVKYPFRPARITPKPLIQGPQTAIVVGPSGEKIYTDEYARVKVHFHWNRHDKSDESSSCWVRVSQPWAGKNWGAMFIPHVDQEVVVSFEEGDPDRPLITGRVYNAVEVVPLALPANKTRSIIRDHGSNHIRLEGAAGKEQIHLYSPYGETKFSIGAPNEGEGIFFSTLKHWLEKITGNHTSEVDGNLEGKVVGNEHKETGGEWKHEITGNVFGVHMSAEHQTLVGLKSELIGGAKHETVVGLKVETFRGKEIKISNGKREKEPTLTSLIKEHIEEVEKEKKKAEELWEKAEKRFEDYETYHSVAKKLDGEWKEAALKCKELAIKDCQKFSSKASEIEHHADSQIKLVSDLIKLG